MEDSYLMRLAVAIAFSIILMYVVFPNKKK